MRLSMATPASRAICCRSALEESLGVEKVLQSNRAGEQRPAPRALDHVVHRRHAMHHTFAVRHGNVGSLPVLLPLGGTVSSMRHLPAAKIAGVSSSAPSNTLASADSVPSISATARCPRICSSSTNASTGGNVPEDGGGGARSQRGVRRRHPFP